MGYVYPTTPATSPWSVETASTGAGRPWEGAFLRYNNVTVGQYFTMPNSTTVETARGLYIGTVTDGDTITLRQSLQVSADGSFNDITVTINRPGFYPFVCVQVVSVTGTIDNIVWGS